MLTVSCKAGGNVKHQHFHKDRGKTRVLEISVFLLSVSFPFDSRVDQRDRSVSHLRAEGKQREAANLWSFTNLSPLTSRCCLHPQLVVAPPGKRRCWRRPGLNSLSPVQGCSQLAVQQGCLLSLPPPPLPSGNLHVLCPDEYLTPVMRKVF